MTGASNLDCHPLTGQCPCKRNVRGQACDECMVSDLLTGNNVWQVDVTRSTNLTCFMRTNNLIKNYTLIISLKCTDSDFALL